MSITQYITNYNNKSSIGSILRAKRLKLLIPILKKFYEKHGEVKIIDIGGTRTYWNILDQNILSDMNIHITLVNLPGSNQPEDETHFSYVGCDGCNLSMFDDNSFHIAHSNSVIEHVGSWSRMEKFAKEVSRVADSYFIQTPNFWFPIEPHCMTPFFHWLPEPIRISLVQSFKLGNWGMAKDISTAVLTVESARLLSRRMFESLFQDAEIKTEKILGLSKSHIAIKS